MANHHSQDPYPFIVNPAATPAVRGRYAARRNRQVIGLLSLDLTEAGLVARDTVQGLVFELELQERLLKAAS